MVTLELTDKQAWLVIEALETLIEENSKVSVDNFRTEDKKIAKIRKVRRKLTNQLPKNFFV